MNKYVIGIFAHPDDAAFGPSGTLAMAAQNGAEVHLVCATSGGAGINAEGHENLAAVREREEKTAAEIIGAKSCEMLGYDDGRLCNEIYLEIAARLITHIRHLAAEPGSEVTLITFDPSGLTGHIDHIVMSHVTTYAYLKLKDEFSIRLKYFCIPDAFTPTANTDWIYAPRGHAEDEIDEIIDVRSVREQKVAAIEAHTTQASDAAALLSRGDALFDEHFIFYRD